MRTCSSLKALGKYRSRAFLPLVLRSEWYEAETPRKGGSSTTGLVVSGSVTTAATAGGYDSASSACFFSFSRSCRYTLLVRGRAKSTHVSVTLSLSSALGSVRSSAATSVGQ